MDSKRDGNANFNVGKMCLPFWLYNRVLRHGRSIVDCDTLFCAYRATSQESGYDLGGDFLIGLKFHFFPPFLLTDLRETSTRTLSDMCVFCRG